MNSVRETTRFLCTSNLAKRSFFAAYLANPHRAFFRQVRDALQLRSHMGPQTERFDLDFQSSIHLYDLRDAELETVYGGERNHLFERAANQRVPTLATGDGKWVNEARGERGRYFSGDIFS